MSGSILQRWYDAVDGVSGEDPAAVLADDLQWVIASDPNRMGGGRAELLAYLGERPAGRRHDIRMTTMLGSVEMVAGKLLAGDETLLTFTASAEQDAAGRMIRYIAVSAPGISLSLP